MKYMPYRCSYTQTSDKLPLGTYFMSLERSRGSAQREESVVSILNETIHLNTVVSSGSFLTHVLPVDLNGSSFLNFVTTFNFVKSVQPAQLKCCLLDTWIEMHSL